MPSYHHPSSWTLPQHHNTRWVAVTRCLWIFLLMLWMGTHSFGFVQQTTPTAGVFSTMPSSRMVLFTQNSTVALEQPSVLDTESNHHPMARRKRLGKSSFLYKQQEISDASFLGPDDLRFLAAKHQGKQVGSSRYKKAWIHWLYEAVEAIRCDLGKNLLVDSETAQTTAEAFEKLFFDLGVAADVGKMPSFEDSAARKGYALEFFCRARSLAEFFLETSTTKYPAFWNHALRENGDCPILVPVDQEAPYEIVSLGGGPGFDFVGVAMAMTFSWHTSTEGGRMGIHATIMDYEEGWGELVTAMDQSTRNLLSPETENGGDPSMSCDWGGKCDITKPIRQEGVNVNCWRLLKDPNPGKLWICQYCVAENAQLLRASGYVFLKELVEEMPTGMLLLLTEVVPRLWPEMVRMLHAEGLHDSVHIGFLQGYHGKQFLLQKKESVLNDGDRESESPFEFLDDQTRDQLEHFERLASYHERKIDAGWERQERKQNGSAYNEQRERARTKPAGHEL